MPSVCLPVGMEGENASFRLPVGMEGDNNIRRVGRGAGALSLIVSHKEEDIQDNRGLEGRLLYLPVICFLEFERKMTSQTYNGHSFLISISLEVSEIENGIQLSKSKCLLQFDPTISLNSKILLWKKVVSPSLAWMISIFPSTYFGLGSFVQNKIVRQVIDIKVQTRWLKPIW